MAQKRGELVVGLDIGTTKICCIVGEARETGLDVIGIGQHPSRGLRKGVVINIESTVASIKRAVEEAELMAGCEIGAVYAGIAGGHIRGFNSQGVVAVKDKEVRPSDVARVIDAARAINIPQDREILHVLPQEFIIDEQDGIKEPLGMSGVRLEAKVHIVTAAVSSAQNIIKCCGRTGLTVADIVLERWFTPGFRDVQRYRDMLLSTDAEGYVGCCIALRDWDARGRLGGVKAPTLAIAGADDPSTPPHDLRAIVDEIPGAQLLVIEKARHLVNAERADEFNDAVLAHL